MDVLVDVLVTSLVIVIVDAGAVDVVVTVG